MLTKERHIQLALLQENPCVNVNIIWQPLDFMEQSSIAKMKPIKTLLRIRGKYRKLSHEKYLGELSSLSDEFKQFARKKDT